MAYLFGTLAFIAALLLSVMLHEAGHLLTAKRFGMKASQFFVGFGPTLWSRRRGETEYGIKAVLLGGYVRIVGYTPLEEVAQSDRPRAFFRRPARQRALVIAGGVVMNFVFAFLLLVVLAMAVGLRDTGSATTTVQRVSECVPVNVQSACTPGRPPSPAAHAGLRDGDRVVAFDGRAVRSWDELRSAIQRARAGQTVTVEVARDGARLTLRARLAELGGAPFLGMTAEQPWQRLGPVDAAVFAARGIALTVAGIGEVIADLPAAVPKLFSEERAQTPGGQVGSVVGATQASGQIFASTGSWRDKIGLYLALVTSVNIFLGALNVLPLLPLDGGHLAVLGYERLRAGIARLRGRPDPGPVNIAKLLPVTYLAVLLLVGLGILLILADLLNPLRLPE
jgi:membrane-associated protease RseP (regulator of RpoE activity)